MTHVIFPGLKPIIFIFDELLRTLAISNIFIDGIFGIKISPPFIILKLSTQNFTAFSIDIKNLVIFLSVTVSSLLRLTKPLKYGITEPLELSTLPYLTTEKTVLTCAERIFEEIKIYLKLALLLHTNLLD